MAACSPGSFTALLVHMVGAAMENFFDLSLRQQLQTALLGEIVLK